jgi:hypothetical protein
MHETNFASFDGIRMKYFVQRRRRFRRVPKMRKQIRYYFTATGGGHDGQTIAQHACEHFRRLYEVFIVAFGLDGQEAIDVVYDRVPDVGHGYT